MSESKSGGTFDGFGRVLVNGMSGAGSRIAMMVVGFALTPFILISLGFVDFGLLAIFGSLAGYLGLLDFGLGGTFVKFITEYTEKDDLAAARQVITFGMLFYVGFGVLLCVPVFLLSPVIVGLFKMPPNEVPHAVTVFREFFVLVMTSLIFAIPGTAVVAKHRMDLASRNNFIGYLAYALTTFVLLRLHFGITGIVIAQAVQQLATVVLQYATARRLIGPIMCDPRRLDPAITRRMFSFGGWTQLTALLNIVVIDAGRFLSAGLVSVASVTFYEVGAKLSFISRTLPNYLVDAVSPMAAAADAHDDRAGLRQLQVTSSLYLLLTTTLIAGFVVGACDPIMRVWLGTSYPYVAAITLWLSIGYVLSSFGTIGVTMLRSIGRPDLEAACVAAGAAVNVVASLVLIRFFGIVGAGMGTCAGWAAFAIFFLVLERARGIETTGTNGLITATRIVAVGTLCAAALAWLVQTSIFQQLFIGKVTGLIGLALCGVLYIALFGVLSWTAGAFRFDQERIERNLLKLRRFSASRLGRMQA